MCAAPWNPGCVCSSYAPRQRNQSESVVDHFLVCGRQSRQQSIVRKFRITLLAGRGHTIQHERPTWGLVKYVRPKLSNRHREEKGTTPARLTFDPDASAVRLDDGLGNVESQACTADSPLSRGPIAVKDVLEVGRRNTGPGIGNRNNDLTIESLRPEDDTNR